MTTDIRSQAAQYYDLNPDVPADVPFYERLVPSPGASVLELGCGTGRVLVPLAKACAYIHGIDLSEAMVAVCRRKLAAEGMAATETQVEVGDITQFALGRTFDLIIAPFRVFQNLETDTAVAGLFKCVREHLAPGGSCVLNVFRPNSEPDTLRREWCTEREKLSWEVSTDGFRVTCHDRRPRMNSEMLVLYPELIYRRYADDSIVDETVLKIAMRCYYPEQFVQLIEKHGFQVLRRWGGYLGEPYGVGSELIVQFAI